MFRNPPWFNTVFENIQDIWGEKQNERPSYGEDLDNLIDMIANAFLCTKMAKSTTNYEKSQPIIDAILYGNDYIISPLIQIGWIKEKANETKLSHSDIVLIHSMTKNLGEEPKQTHLFYVLNQHLRENPDVKDACYIYFENLNKALCKLEESQYAENLYRYINTDKIWNREDEIDMSFASCSLDSIATDNMAKGTYKPVKFILLYIDSKKYRNISTFSFYANEKEAMILGNNKFKVTRKRECKKENMTVYMLQ